MVTRRGPFGWRGPRRAIGLTSIVLTSAILSAGGCARRGPRDVGNQNPRSEFVDGPNGPSRAHDAGAEPERINAATSPAGRTPRPVANAETRVLALDASRVYFADPADDSLAAVPKSPPADPATVTPTRIARRGPMPGALSIDVREAALAWIASPGDTILRVPATGGTPTTIRDRGIFTSVAAESGDVFFTEVHGDGGALTRVTGTTAARLATFEGTPHGVVVDGDNVYVATSSRLVATTRTRGDVSELARGVGFESPQVDETWVYATAVDPKSRARLLVRAKKTGGTVETVATGVRDAPIALRGGIVYWFAADRPALLSRPVDAGQPASPTVVSEDAMLEHVTALAIDDDGVYVATGTGESARIVVIALR